MAKEILRNFNIQGFQDSLLNWYHQHKRALPWRETSDPYIVWISEIMLQQTKVDTVIPYFNRFIDKYPTPHDLAQAKEEEVLKSWEGLGYYSRARNLQTAVREVVEKYDGIVPDNKEQLGALKGVGPYTRGAILSIAFNQAEPAVDGNVMRVFSRVLLINDDIALSKTKKQFEKVVQEVISKEDPSSFNQGIMDLGATICTPKSPACLLCPVQSYCRAYEVGAENDLPVKKKAKKQKEMFYAGLIIQNQEGEFLIEKRPETGLLANFYQFPMVPLRDPSIEEIEEWFKKNYRMRIDIQEPEGKVKHVFSHIIWQLHVYTAETDASLADNPNLQFVEKEMLEVLPFPVPHQKVMRFIK